MIELTKEQRQKAGYHAPKGHKLILELFGVSKGNTCKNCLYLRRIRYSRIWYRCNVFGPNLSDDWRANWQACGQYEKTDTLTIEIPVSNER